MAIRKRGNIWWIDIKLAGRRIQESAHTSDRAAAQELHDKLKAGLWREVKLGEKPDFTWENAVKLYISEKQHLRQLEASILPQIDWLTERIGYATPIRTIGTDMVTRLRLERASQLTPKKTMPKQATINYPLTILHSVLNLAKKHGMVDSVPHIERPNPQNGRVRWITQTEANAIINEAVAFHQAYSHLIEFSFETGLRQANALGLLWSWLDLPNKSLTVPAEHFKTGKPLTIPLSDRSIAIVKTYLNNGSDYVFIGSSGEPFTVNDAQYRIEVICAKLGITDFHWHDIRHTWATWHVRAGTPLEVLQKLGGWSDYRMVLRYAVFAQDHLAAYCNNLKRDIPATPHNNVVAMPAAA